MTKIKPHHLLAALLILAQSPSLYAEETNEAKATKLLREQGYVITDIGRTFLGRLKVEAELKGEKREIIIDKHTGVILRDAPVVADSLFAGWFWFGTDSDGGEGLASADSGNDNGNTASSTNGDATAADAGIAGVADSSPSVGVGESAGESSGSVTGD